MNKPKILIWDLETGYNLVKVFSLFRRHTSIPYYSIESERYIICGAWQWLGKRRPHHVSVADFPRIFKADPTNDYYVVVALHRILSEADAIVAHYGDNFDLKFFNTRALFHGLPPIAPLVQYDTYKIAKRHFLLNSNKLDYLARFLKLPGKLKTHPDLWDSCFHGSVEAVRTMVKYCTQDITLLLQVFLRLRPYGANKLNWNLFTKDTVCPDCGSYNLEKRGTRKTRTRQYQRYQCKDCHTWSSNTHSTSQIKAEVK